MKTGTLRIITEDPASPRAIECVARYCEELDSLFEEGFDPGKSVSADPDELRPPQGYFLIAEFQGKAVGCCALKCRSGFGEVKRMWVDPSVRGLGVGSRLLARTEALARELNLPALRLDTNKNLTEARALYQHFGYREIPPYNDNPYAHYWFEKRMET